MRVPFQFTLEGKDWWKPFIPVLAAYSIYLGLTQAMSLSRRGGDLVSYFIVLLVVFLAYLAVTTAFSIVILRVVLPKLRIGDKGFEFRGDVGKYLGMIFLGTFLSIITLGIYIPWFSRKIVAYLASETRFADQRPEFLGRPIKLLLIFLPFLVLVAALAAGTTFLALNSDFSSNAHRPSIEMASQLPAAPHAAYATNASYRPETDYGREYGGGSAAMLTTVLTFILVLLIFVPFMYLMYRWYVNFSCGGFTLRWATKFWPSCIFLLGQTCLTIITLGIYWPAACLRIYRYFAGRTVIEKDGVEKGRLGFEGAIGKGFCLLWCQALLCLVTLGLYTPWGTAKVGRWILEKSWYEGQVAEATAGPA